MATPQKAPPAYDRIWQRISCRTACTMAALLSASQLRRWGQGRVAAGHSTRRAAERSKGQGIHLASIAWFEIGGVFPRSVFWYMYTRELGARN